MLKLQEKGILDELKSKWWTGNCTKGPANAPASSSGELSMAHVGGVFLVLLGGCLISLLVAIVEFLWNIKKVAVEEKVMFYKQKIICMLERRM